MLGMNAVISRLLSPDDLGIYFLILSITSFASALGGLGLKNAIVKVVAETLGKGDTGKARSAIGLALLWVMLGSLIVASAFAMGGGKWIAERVFHSPMLGDLAILISLLIVLSAASTQLAETFRGFHDIRMATITNGLAISLLPALGIVFLWAVKAQASLTKVILVHVGALAFVVILAGLFLSTRVAHLEGEGGYPSKALLRLGIPMMVSGLSFGLQVQIAIWIIAAYLPASEVALYGAANRMVLLVATPLVLLNAVIPPIIAEMYARAQRRELEIFLGQATALVFLPAALTLVIFVFFGEYLLAGLFGTFYGKALAVLVILSLGQALNTLAGPCGLTLMMTGNQQSLMLIAFASIVFQTVVGLILVRPYGIVGVALGSTCALVVQNGVMLVLTRTKTGIWTYANFSELLAQIRVMKGIS
jgi:O-antigen/teichoic acid export membrane protein